MAHSLISLSPVHSDLRQSGLEFRIMCLEGKFNVFYLFEVVTTSKTFVNLVDIPLSFLSNMVRVPVVEKQMCA